MAHSEYQKQLLEACAANLRDFGYPDARGDNVMTTPIFWRFAEQWLEERAERGDKEAAALVEEANAD